MCLQYLRRQQWVSSGQLDVTAAARCSLAGCRGTRCPQPASQGVCIWAELLQSRAGPTWCAAEVSPEATATPRAGPAPVQDRTLPIRSVWPRSGPGQVPCQRGGLLSLAIAHALPSWRTTRRLQAQHQSGRRARIFTGLRGAFWHRCHRSWAPKSCMTHRVGLVGVVAGQGAGRSVMHSNHRLCPNREQSICQLIYEEVADHWPLNRPARDT